MTAIPALFGDDTDFVLRVSVSRLEPDYQAGDHITARKATTAEPGQVVVALLKTGAAIVRWPMEDARVLGVVTGMFRRL